MTRGGEVWCVKVLKIYGIFTTAAMQENRGRNGQEGRRERTLWEVLAKTSWFTLFLRQGGAFWVYFVTLPNQDL